MLELVQFYIEPSVCGYTIEKPLYNNTFGIGDVSLGLIFQLSMFN